MAIDMESWRKTLSVAMGSGVRVSHLENRPGMIIEYVSAAPETMGLRQERWSCGYCGTIGTRVTGGNASGKTPRCDSCGAPHADL